jgi:glucuronate isomerase
VFEPYTQVLDASYAAKLFDSLLAGSASEAEAREFAGHMLSEMARMSTNDGLVMTIHAGVYRNHSSATHKRFGPDSGHDIPVRAEFTKNLRPLLEAYGAHPNLTVILFSLDETTWGRELAPLAGFYPSVLVGAPWWFLDAPDAAKRFRRAVTDTIGFYRGSGFIDDTRAFLSIPARHDMARRIDCNFLAELVFEGRISLDQAMQIASDLVVAVPRKAFKL